MVKETATNSPDALYLRAVIASRDGNREAARKLLLQGAQLGHADSIYTLATMDVQGLGVPKDASAACTKLEQAVKLGSNSARRLLAALTVLGLGRGPDWRRGVSLLIDAAQAGDRSAMRDVGLLIGMAETELAISSEILVNAARLGDGLAAFAVIRRSQLRPCPVGASELASWTESLTAAGHPFAHQIRNAASAAVERDAAPIVWSEIREILSKAPQKQIVAQPLTTDRPLIVAVQDFATIEECDYLTGKAEPMLRPSAVVDERTGQTRQHPVRTSSATTLWPIDQDLVVHCLDLRLASLVGTAPDHGEMLSILCYQPGQQYLPHFDFLAESATRAAELERLGQRISTALVYLNDDYAGGETRFLTPGLQIKGKSGHAIAFRNTMPDGSPDLTTRHAGLPVTQGTKWLASKWFRSRKFDP